ncbi:MAG: GNAT family N-acetyltransferase [Candidatus Brocadia sp.]|nr:GNAT family N-acetyltransferase [Candidatus Brocadia sp.]
MLEIDKKKFIFKTKEIWFSDYPFDIKKYHGVIFRECKNKAALKGFTCEKFTTLVIDLTQDLNAIWNSMTKSCRYCINKAVRDGVKIKRNEDYEAFYEINKTLKKRKGAPVALVDMNFMKRYGTLFTAYINGKIVGGHFCLEDENNIRGLIGATKRLEVSKEEASLIGNANRLLEWESIKYAKEKGIKEYDMGGFYTGKEKDEQKERINMYKKGFGGNIVTHYIYQKSYSKIYEVTKKAFVLAMGY